MENIWHFDEVNLYKILCPYKLKSYAKVHYQNYNKGDIIYFQEEIAQKVYLVSKGKVKIVSYNENGEEIVKAILSKGEIFGEKALLGEGKREEFALSIVDNTALCPMNIDNMYELMRNNKRFSLRIYKIIGLRMKRLERRLERLLFKDVKTRIVEFIQDLVEESGATTTQEFVLEHPYTHKDIADLVGSRRETISAILNKLKTEGILDYKRSHFRIIDYKRLKDMSSADKTTNPKNSV